MSEKDKTFVFYSDELNCKSENGKYTVEGHITTGDLDLVNDIVTKAGMDDMIDQLATRNIKLDWEHETMVGKSEVEMQTAKTKNPLGRIVDYEKDGKGIKIRGELNPAWKRFDSKGDVVMTFKDVWTSIKNRFLDAFSIAYVPTRTKSKDLMDGKTARLLDGINLINVALTGNPINPSATMTAVMAKSVAFMEQNKSKGDNMTEDKEKEKKENKSEETQEETKEQETQTETTEEPEKQPEVETEGKSDKSMVEVKNRINAVEKKNAELIKEVADLKSVVETARSKAIGTESKAQKEEKDSNPQFKGPLDIV